MPTERLIPARQYSAMISRLEEMVVLTGHRTLGEGAELSAICPECYHETEMRRVLLLVLCLSISIVKAEILKVEIDGIIDPITSEFKKYEALLLIAVNQQLSQCLAGGVFLFLVIAAVADGDDRCLHRL